MMQAATEGALSAGKPVAGIRIQREAGTTVLVASYLPHGSQTFCRFLSSRKVALVDAGVRMKESDRTAFIFLPGGLGTMDELFEVRARVGEGGGVEAGGCGVERGQGSTHVRQGLERRFLHTSTPLCRHGPICAPPSPPRCPVADPDAGAAAQAWLQIPCARHPGQLRRLLRWTARLPQGLRRKWNRGRAGCGVPPLLLPPCQRIAAVGRGMHSQGVRIEPLPPPHCRAQGPDCGAGQLGRDRCAAPGGRHTAACGGTAALPCMQEQVGTAASGSPSQHNLSAPCSPSPIILCVQYYLHESPLSPSKVYRASAFLQVGGTATGL